MTYQLSVTNNGPNDAPDVVISDTLPTGTTFVSAEPPAGGACNVVPEDGLTIVGCAIDLLPVGETSTAVLTIGTPPDLTGSLANTAFVGSGVLDAELESIGSQNTSTATGEVVAQLDAAVDVVADRDMVAPGGTASFTVTVTNAGPSVARAVELVNTLPAGLTAPAVSEPGPTPSRPSSSRSPRSSSSSSSRRVRRPGSRPPARSATCCPATSSPSGSAGRCRPAPRTAPCSPTPPRSPRRATPCPPTTSTSPT